VARAAFVPLVAVAIVVVVAGTLVALTLRQPDVPTFTPTPPVPRDAGRTLVGPIVYTVDARSGEHWRRFSFRVGAVVEDASAEWDLAFRRYQIIANGGPGFSGRAGIRDLGPVAFDAVPTVPTDGYQENAPGPDPRNPAIVGWYRYGFFSHVLDPKPHVWAVRTTDGRYAKLAILGYYCPGSQPGCVTFRYVFQGDGSASVAVR
jgi:hypothetical protein